MQDISHLAPQTTPSRIFFFLKMEQIWIRDEDGRLFPTRHRLEPMNLFIQSGDYLLTGSRFSLTEMKVFDSKGLKHTMPVQTEGPVWTADFRNDKLYLGSEENGELQFRVININGEMLHRLKLDFKQIARGNNQGKLFSSFEDNVWTIWNPKGLEIVTLTPELDLISRFETELPAYILQFKDGVISDMMLLQKTGQTESLAEMCAQWHQQPIALIPIGFFLLEKNYILSYKLQILQGCVMGNSVDSLLRSDLILLDKKNGAMTNIITKPHYYVSGFHGNNRTLIGRKWVGDGTIGNGSWIHEAMPFN